MIMRELVIAIANGFALGIIMAIGCQLVYHDLALSRRPSCGNGDQQYQRRACREF